MKETNWKYDCNKQETCKHCENEFHSKIDYKGFYEAIKNFMRNLGKSNMIVKYEIQDIIDEFESKGGKK